MSKMTYNLTSGGPGALVTTMDIMSDGNGGLEVWITQDTGYGDGTTDLVMLDDVNLNNFLLSLATYPPRGMEETETTTNG